MLGERRAARYLRAKGLVILTTNWCFGRREVDIVARQGSTLVFVEVKTRIRHSSKIFPPEDAVDFQKQSTLRGLAEQFEAMYGTRLLRNRIRARRFDIITITYQKKLDFYLGRCSINHLIDAF